MEATSALNRIQISQKTANLLLEEGEKKWLQPRQEMVPANGLGQVQTYLIANNKGEVREIKDKDGSSSCSDHSASSELLDSYGEDGSLMEVSHSLTSSSHKDLNKQERLVDWQVQSLMRLLKQIAACRKSSWKREEFSRDLMSAETPLEDVQEVIQLPEYDINRIKRVKDIDSIKLNPAVERQLRDYVQGIAATYRSNP
jgi:hypothetical protein